MTACKMCGYEPDRAINWTVEIVLDVSSPSQNQVGANRKGRSGIPYRRYRRLFESQLHNYTLPDASGPRRIVLTRQYGKGKRAYDYGNLVGGMKPLLDEITKKGWLISDAPSHCHDYYKQERSLDGQDHVVIEIHEFA